MIYDIKGIFSMDSTIIYGIGTDTAANIILLCYLNIYLYLKRF